MRQESKEATEDGDWKMFGENTPGQIPGKPTQTETNNHHLRETRVPLLR